MRASKTFFAGSPLLFVSVLGCGLLSALSAGCDGNGGGSGGSGGGSGGTGGESVCTEYVTAPAQNPVTVRIVNQTANDLYIGPEAAGGCGQVDAFSVSDDGGNPVGWRLQACSFTCEELQKGACACAADCALPYVWRIAPAGALEVPWNGTIFTPETMPDECYDASCGTGQTCSVEREPSGALTLSATAWSEVTGSCGASCTCTPDATGTCTIGSGDVAVAGTSATAQAQVDTVSGTIELIFQ